MTIHGSATQALPLGEIQKPQDWLAFVKGMSDLTPHFDKRKAAKRGSGGMDKPKHAAPRPNRAFLGCSRDLLWPEPRIPDRLRPRRSQQAFADEVEVGQGAGHKQPVGVLLKTPVADIGEMEHAFDDAEGVLDAAANVGLDTVTSALNLVHHAFVPIPAAGEVAGLRGVLPEDIGLALIGRIAPHPGLLAMEQIRQDRGVMNVGGSGHYGMDDLGLAVDPDVGLHAEVPLVPFTRLVHVGIALFVPVLGRRRGVDDGGVHDRALAHLDALGLQVVVDLLEEFLAEIVLLEEMAELQDGGLIGHRFPTEINADEPTHGLGAVQGLLGPGIGEIEPLLEESDPQHTLEPHRRPAVLALGVVGRDHRTEVLPGHYFAHFRQESLATGRFAVGLEGTGG